NLIKSIDGTRIVEVNETNINQVRDYDLKICHGIRHVNFLMECIKIPKEEVSFLCAINRNNQIQGYLLAMISQFNTILLQPLYADSKEIAELLLYHCLSSSEQNSVKSPLSEISRENGLQMQIIDNNGCNEAKDIMGKLGGSFKCTINSPLLFNKKI